MNMGRAGQSTIEYALLICVLVAALMAMRDYVHRGLQGRLRQQGTEVGQGFFYAPKEMDPSTTLTTQTITEFQEAKSGDPPLTASPDPDARIMITNYSMDSTRTSTIDENVKSYY